MRTAARSRLKTTFLPNICALLTHQYWFAANDTRPANMLGYQFKQNRSELDLASGDPLWISRKEEANIDTLTAIRAAAAVLVSRCTYSESVVVEPTITWGSLPPLATNRAFHVVGARVICLDDDIRVRDFLDQVEVHASVVLPMSDAEIQTVRSSSPLGGNMIAQVIIMVHRKSSTDPRMYQCIEDGMNSGDAALLVEWMPSVDSSVLRVQVLGRDIDIENSTRLQSSLEQIYGEILTSTGETTLGGLFSAGDGDIACIRKWNGSSLYTVGAFVHHLFENKAWEQPAAAAVHSWDGDLTYEELDHCSSQLAARLVKEYGIGPEKFVPLCFEKTLWTVVAMLAVLKAGGAFVPLDPAYPEERIKDIIAQTSATLVLSSIQHAGKCAVAGAHVLVINDSTCPREGDQADFYALHNDTSAAAYVIFTSGSTGSPKGVVIEHQQISTFSVYGGQAMGFTNKPRVLQFASYTFDACILEIITTLVHGGCVCVPSDWQRMNDLTGFMNEARVSTAFFTPSLLVNIVPDEVETLDTVVLGGEAVPFDLVAQWRDRLRIIIAYGPTECCVICSTLDLNQSQSFHSGDIGFLAGARPWIVSATDPDSLVPVGTVGELLIEGPVLARGYINDRAKTDAAFVSNPKWLRRAGRLYKTGDLARYNADGSLNFVCRKDNQVKLRGQRLELGEVEQQIRHCLFPSQVDVVAEIVKPVEVRRSPFLVAFVAARQSSRTFVPERDVYSLEPQSTANRPRFSRHASALSESRTRSSVASNSSSGHSTRPPAVVRAVTSTGTHVRTVLRSRTFSSTQDVARPTISTRRSQYWSIDRSTATSIGGIPSLGKARCRPYLPSTTASSRSTTTPRSVSTFSVGSDASSHTESSIYELPDRPLVSGAVLESQIANLKKSLGEKVPGYMVPSTFVQLDELPLTTSGKTDRRKLREIALSRHSAVCDAVTPSGTEPLSWSPAEAQMQALWATALNLPIIAIVPFANFFYLGGDSITSMRLVAAARKVGWSVSTHELFNYPILSDLTARIEQRERSEEVLVEPVSAYSQLPLGEELQVIREAALLCQVEENLIEDIYPCTPLQAGLLVLSEKTPGTYILNFTYRLSPATDLIRLKRAWQTVLSQNPILRTRIVQTKQSPLLQVVVKDELDWMETQTSTGLPSSPSSGVAMGLGMPLAKFRIVRDTKSDHLRLTWTIHHALIDGWSLPLVADSVKQAYLGETMGLRPAFSEFVKHISNLDIASCEEFWRSRLEGTELPTFPVLPTAKHQPQTTSAFRYQVDLPQKPTRGITVATTIRAAWSLVIARYSDSNDVVFGHTISGRDAELADIHSMIGPTITTVPVRVRIDGGQLIADYLDRSQKEIADLVPFAHLGLARISRLSRDAEAGCAFRNLLIIHPLPTVSGTVESRLMVQESESTTEILDYGLLVECTLGTNSLQLCARYDAAVIDALQIERLMEQFEHVILQLGLATQFTRVADIDVVSPMDMAEVRHWNQEMPEACHARLMDLILPHMTREPHQAAVCAWDGDLTRAELFHLSARLGQQLRKMGVRPGVMVPTCFEKSAWAVVTMLAVMLAGGACAPLDPCYPPLRRDAILETLNSRLIISSSRHQRLFEEARQQLMVVDRKFIESLTDEPCVASSLLPSDPAYIIFTSGSTGQPKGIVIEHKALCTSIQHHGKFMRLNSSSRVLQFAAFTFDISFSDIFATLAYGGCVCVPSDADRLNDLEKTIRDLKVNSACLTTTVARQLRPSMVKSLQNLTIAGEAPTQEILQTWADKVCLMNMYGPAECTIYSCGTADVGVHDVPTNMGRGLGARLWITDAKDYDRLAPVGATGELLIEGPILARSYLADDIKTAAAFIRNPRWLQQAEPGLSHRLYRTGDLVRYASDGSIIYCGRRDTQVKIRGQRVELNDVEYALQQCMPVSFHVVVELVALLKMETNPRLIAFFSDDTKVIKAGNAPINVMAAKGAFCELVSNCQAAVSKKLPAHLIPQDYVPLTYVPISESGKTDRKSLRQLAAGLTMQDISGLADDSQRSFQLSNCLEEKLRELWSQVLRLEAQYISANDNFFRLGGDSVIAMQLVAAAREAGCRLSVESVFKAATLKDLALELCDIEEEESSVPTTIPFSLLGEIPSLTPLLYQAAYQCQVSNDLVEDILPCTAAQEASMDFSRLHPHQGYCTENHAGQFTYSLPASIDLERLRSAWLSVAERYAFLRTRIIRTAECCYQVVLRNPISLAISFNLDDYLKQDLQQRMTFGEALHRFGIIQDKVSGLRHLVWTASHAMYDGFSISLVLADLAKLYWHGVHSNGIADTNGFLSYVRKVNQSSSDLFWSTHFEGVRSAKFCDLPHGFVTYATDRSLKRDIAISFPPNSDITFSTFVHVACALFIARYTGSQDVVLRLVRTGRDVPVPNMERLVAPTFSIIPFRIQVDRNQTIRETLLKVQRTMTETIPFQHAGFHNIRKLNNHTLSACDSALQVSVHPHMSQGNPADSPPILNFRSGRPVVYDAIPLALEFKMNECGLEAAIHFDPNVFHREGVIELLGQLEALLQQCVHTDGGRELGIISAPDVEHERLYRTKTLVTQL